MSSINSLFPVIRQEILALTYQQPDRWWFLSELASFIGKTPSSLQRELKSLASSGILRTKRDGNRLYFRAETNSPIFAPLRELLDQTIGSVQALGNALEPLAESISCAFIYGSVARQQENVLSDVDVIVIGEIGLADISTLLRSLEKKFGREFNAKCYSRSEFKKKTQNKNHFLLTVLREQKVFLIGNADELDKLISQ